MTETDIFILARAVHVIGVVIWIGGVAFVTIVLLPAIREITDSQKRLELFEKLEGRFATQAKIETVIVGLSGLYMLYSLDAWWRYQEIQYWWMHLMTFIWAVFTLALFVLEPLILHRKFKKEALADSDKAFALVHRMHRIILALSLIAIFGAVTGSHGFQF